jgi:hypothetical protein
MELKPVDQPCPNCGAVPEEGQPRKGLVVHERRGCLSFLLLMILWIGFIVAASYIVPLVSGGFSLSHWIWLGMADGSPIDWLADGGYWHFIVVFVLAGLLAIVVQRKVFRINPRNNMFVVCGSCGQRSPWSRNQ